MGHCWSVPSIYPPSCRTVSLSHGSRGMNMKEGGGDPSLDVFSTTMPPSQGGSWWGHHGRENRKKRKQDPADVSEPLGSHQLWNSPHLWVFQFQKPKLSPYCSGQFEWGFVLPGTVNILLWREQDPFTNGTALPLPPNTLWDQCIK
jgi:hypothetical protein